MSTLTSPTSATPSCTECHSDIAASYAKHPMGRSLSPVGVAEIIENFTAEGRLPLTLDGHAYRVRSDGDRQFRRETRFSPTGKEALVTEFEAVYAVGSGRTGRSYLMAQRTFIYVADDVVRRSRLGPIARVRGE